MTYQLVFATISGITYPGIQCLRCTRISWNANDIGEKYCGFCHRFHEDDAFHVELADKGRSGGEV